MSAENMYELLTINKKNKKISGKGFSSNERTQLLKLMEKPVSNANMARLTKYGREHTSNTTFGTTLGKLLYNREQGPSRGKPSKSGVSQNHTVVAGVPVDTIEEKSNSKPRLQGGALGTHLQRKNPVKK
jgi:hypothetical protein